MQSPAARYLHLATHGFFAPADVKRADTDDREVLDTDSNPETSVEGWNPGLLSGIVLAGVNQPVDGLSDDGVLTAAEVAALDLSAAQLVVLSACETGLGQMAGGEGALGLQRALQTAGARSVVSSLWKVDDAATVLLMSEFYKNLWQNRQPPLKAFRAAQLSLLNGKVDPSALRGLDLIDDAPRPETSGGRLSPRLWAAFVISGSPE
jgi:CHAT domain-containing protein